MRCSYHERYYKCGNDYIDEYIYPEFKFGKGRKAKAKPTKEAQARLNEIHALGKLTRELNAYFTNDDIEIHLTYRDDVLPKTPEDAMNDFQNFIRRVQYRRKKRGLEPAQWILVPAGDGINKRFHAHITMSGGMDRDELEKIWGFGWANSKSLQYNENGVEALAVYVSRQFTEDPAQLVITDTGEVVDCKSPFKKKWYASRGIHDPEPNDRNCKMSQKKVEEMAEKRADAWTLAEQLHPGYEVSDIRTFYNDVNGGYYIRVKYYRRGTKLANKRQRNKGGKGNERKIG